MTRMTVTFSVRNSEPQSRHIVSAIDVPAKALDWAPMQVIGMLTQEGVIEQACEVRLHSISLGHEQVGVAVPFPVTGGGPGWGVVCPVHQDGVPTDYGRATAEAFAVAVACASPEHRRP